MKKSISETLEKESSILSHKIGQLEEQLRSIHEMKEEKFRIQSEPQIETLIQAAYRFEVEHEANKKIETLAFRPVFSDVKRDEEIVSIIKLITP